MKYLRLSRLPTLTYMRIKGEVCPAKLAEKGKNAMTADRSGSGYYFCLLTAN